MSRVRARRVILDARVDRVCLGVDFRRDFPKRYRRQKSLDPSYLPFDSFSRLARAREETHRGAEKQTRDLYSCLCGEEREISQADVEVK